MCQRSGRGTGGHLVPLLGDIIATTSPPIDQQQGSASTVFHRARLVPVLFPPSGGEGRAEQTSKRKKREKQGEGCRRHLRQFLASLLFRLLPPPSTPSPAAHHFARLCLRSVKGRAGISSASGRCNRHHIATPRRRSTNNQQQGSASGCRSSCPPRPLPRHLRPFLPSVCCHHLLRPRPFFPSVFVCCSCYSSP